MPVEQFHSAVARWFAASFEAPTEAQGLAWPAIASGRDVLIAAPTGSGKTLAAFPSGIDLLRASATDSARIVDQPPSGIAAELATQGFGPCHIRTQVRTGDTPQSERVA